jgi:hypothetical protein
MTGPQPRRQPGEPTVRHCHASHLPGDRRTEIPLKRPEMSRCPLRGVGQSVHRSDLNPFYRWQIPRAR